MTLKTSMNPRDAAPNPRTPRKGKKSRDASITSPYFSPQNTGNSLGKSSSRVEQVQSSEALEDTLPTCEPVALPPDVQTLHQSLAGLKPNLIQECVAHDPWMLLVAVTLLNKTAGKLAIPVFWKMVERWPTPLDFSQASPEELVDMIRPLGTQTVRANRLIDLSKVYMQDPPSRHDVRASRAVPIATRNSPFFSSARARYPATPISHLPGAGVYALDSYRIFCTTHEDPFSEEWKSVLASDKELARYLKWKWAFNENVQWSSSKGPGRPVTSRYLRSLIAELEENP